MGKKTKIEKPPESFINLASAPKGFICGGVRAGIKTSGLPDLGILMGEKTLNVAGVSTTNRFAAAPVLVTNERLEASGGKLRGVIVNSGNANACTGLKGLRDAAEMTMLAELAVGEETGAFAVSSTGVIGHKLPMPKIRRGVAELVPALSPEGWEVFARSIMTTDIRPKSVQAEVKFGRGKSARILGVCKGAGMIAPNMATMLVYLATDFPLTPAQARAMLKTGVKYSFNAITVDSDTSTNDTVLLMSSGAAMKAGDVTAAMRKIFTSALTGAMQDLARQIVRDGEGATRLIEVSITGAKTEADAFTLARSIADSPLCKTAIFGRDPNWGRIAMALGKAGVEFRPGDVAIKLQGKSVMRGGLPVKFDEAKLSRAIADAEDVTVEAVVGKGKGQAKIWTCDLTYEYVKINAEYTT